MHCYLITQIRETRNRLKRLLPRYLVAGASLVRGSEEKSAHCGDHCGGVGGDRGGALFSFCVGSLGVLGGLEGGVHSDPVVDGSAKGDRTVLESFVGVAAEEADNLGLFAGLFERELNVLGGAVGDEVPVEVGVDVGAVDHVGVLGGDGELDNAFLDRLVGHGDPALGGSLREVRIVSLQGSHGWGGGRDVVVRDGEVALEDGIAVDLCGVHLGCNSLAVPRSISVLDAEAENSVLPLALSLQDEVAVELEGAAVVAVVRVQGQFVAGSAGG